MNKTLITVLVLAFVFVSIVLKNKKSETYYKPANDSGVLEAKRQAQSKIGEFISELNANKDPNIAFNIKTPFVEEGKVEHMWVLVSSYEKGSFHGTLNNDPEWVKNIKIGDTVVVNEADVEDWIISDGTKVVGDFSTKVFRK